MLMMSHPCLIASMRAVIAACAAVFMLLCFGGATAAYAQQDGGAEQWQSLEDFGIDPSDMPSDTRYQYPQAGTTRTQPSFAPRAAVSLAPRRTIFRAGDIAVVSVKNVQSVSGRYPIDARGYADFPLIGLVKVKAQSTDSLQNTLTQLYGTQYLNDPDITVTLETLAIGKVLISGQVTNPGIYTLPDYQTLSEIITQAGGMLAPADQSDIIVLRDENGDRKPYSVDYVSVATGANPDPIMAPSDFIYIKKSGETITLDSITLALRLLSLPLAASLGEPSSANDPASANPVNP